VNRRRCNAAASFFNCMVRGIHREGIAKAEYDF